jgi:hypothetical protein
VVTIYEVLVVSGVYIPVVSSSSDDASPIDHDSSSCRHEVPIGFDSSKDANEGVNVSE